MMRVGLFGGSFNPIHNGHLQIANHVLKEDITDEVWFIPCGNHAFGKKLANGKNRIEMINLAIKNNPKLKVLDIEIKSKNKSFISETIKTLKKEYPSKEFIFIIGTDNIAHLDKWYDFNYLKDNVVFVLVKRMRSIVPKNIKVKFRNVLDIKNDISSTKIRENIRKNYPIQDFLPILIEKYIRKKELYNGKTLYKFC